ncbi:unnamed protein product [Onchocerca flexuosa]|uniref:40S ribosomal protein S2 n=1 Tax=Onchocerca flexuosa TaxID=387005 RepID=A0A183H7B7_9BILA|nr:unnamed protein product [Onchocerca flexuosa]
MGLGKAYICSVVVISMPDKYRKTGKQKPSPDLGKERVGMIGFQNLFALGDERDGNKIDVVHVSPTTFLLVISRQLQILPQIA